MTRILLRLSQASYLPNEPVSVYLDGTGQNLVIESTLLNASQPLAVLNGTALVAIGPAREGLQSVSVRYGTNRAVVALFFAMAGGRLRVTAEQAFIPERHSITAFPANSLIQRVVGGVNQPRLLRAFQTALSALPAKRAPVIGSTVVFCTLAAGVAEVPGANVAALKLCRTSAVGMVKDFAEDIIDRLIEVLAEDGVINADEAKALKMVWGSMELIVDTKEVLENLLKGRNASRVKVYYALVKAMADTTSVTLQDEGVELLIGGSTELIDRTTALVKFAKELP